MTEAIQKLTLPKWGLSMQEGTIVGWLVEEGAVVAPGDEIVEIETEKVNNVLESPVGGLLRRRIAAVGTTVPVGAVIGLFADAEVPDTVIDDFATHLDDFKLADAEDESTLPRQVEVNGQTINYLALGGGAAPPLVLVHGFGGDINTWMFNQSELAVAREVIALDLPGHGASTKDVGRGDISTLAESVRGFMDALGIACAHVAGHSLGGAVALELALSNSGRIASVILLSPAGLGGEVDPTFITDFISADRRKSAKAVLARLVHDADLVSRDMIEKFLRYKRTEGVTEALKRIAGQVFDEAHASRYDTRLEQIAAPILCLWGAGDSIVPPSHADALQDEAELHVLDGASHLVHMERASAVNALITAFLESPE